MHLRTATVLGVSAALIGAALVVPAASAAPATGSTPTSAPSSARTAPGAGSDLGRAARPVTRFIVKMNDRGPVTGAVTDAVAAAAGVPGAKPGRRLTGGARLVALSQPVSQADAVAAAKRITARGDVAYAQPDTWIQVADAYPSPPGWDSSLEQWDMWDETAASSAGGYGAKAVEAWARTQGDASIVVAVVDTGITRHPDLDANVVKGYDFIGADDAPPFGGLNLQPYTANDGNGRDSDPSDPGDWVTSTEQTSANWFKGCQAESSSWHGTHVAGTVAAVQGNGIGVQGVAPGVRIQPVRAVGKCGGYLSDIADGIRWAAGGDVPGVPANATPAMVINISLGGPGPCDAGGSYMQDAITDATGRGATVVVAAGNANTTVAYDPNATDAAGNNETGSTPANCNGVVVVGAAGRDGSRASYSNYGPEVTLSAQGGRPVAGDGVISTINSGTTRPGAPTYGGAAYVGTSMATPHVSGAVALMQSTRVPTGAFLTPAEVKNRLATATGPGSMVQPFADTSCNGLGCGSGILDLSKPLPAADPTTARGVQVAASGPDVQLDWLPSADDGGSTVTYAVQRKQAADATGATLHEITASGTSATDSPVDGEYVYRVVARNNGGEGIGAWSDPVTVPGATGAPGFVTEVGVTSTPGELSASWSPPSSPAVTATSYSLRYRVQGIVDWTVVDPATSPWSAALPEGGYDVQIRANASVAGPWSRTYSATVAAVVQKLAAATTTVRPYTDGFQDTPGIVVRSNVAATGTVTIKRGDVVQGAPEDVTLDGTADALVEWDALQLPPGTYTVALALTSPSSPDTPAVVPTSGLTVTVGTSQVGTPSVSRSSSSVYPYKDSYKDTVTVTTTTNVPATQSWRIRNSKGSTVRTWSYTSKALVRTVTWNGRRSDGTSLPAGSYSLTVTTKGGEGTSTSRTVSLSLSSKRLLSTPFSTTVYPSSVSYVGLQGGSATLVDKAYDGVTKKELVVKGGADGAYDVLAASASIPSSVIPATGVKVATCLRRSPYGNDNLLASGYMSSSTRFSGWFFSVVDETQAVGQSTGLNEVTVASGTIDCRTPSLSAPASAVASNRLRWTMFNLGASSSAYVAIYSFKITGKRYYLA